MPDYFDMHCHILFGVDDGAKSPEDSMAMLRQEYDSGVRTVCLTPHYRRGMFECPPEQRREHFARLGELAARQFPDLRLVLGCEVHAHMDLVQELRDGSCLTLGDTPFVLLEFPVGARKRSIIGQCRSLMVGGYCPILAHAERCIAIRREPDVLKRLVEMGVYIQMNAGSITGDEGLSQKWFCKRAMRRNLLHFIGSDAHDPKKYRPNLEKCARYLERTMGAAYRDQIMTGNPREILEGSM